MIPNDVIQRLMRIDRTLQAEPQTDQVRIARKKIEDAMYWVDMEKVRRVDEKKRDLADRLARQEEDNHS